MTLEQYYALREAIENLFTIAALKPINWMDLVTQNAKNIQFIIETVRPCTNPEVVFEQWRPKDVWLRSPEESHETLCDH